MRARSARAASRARNSLLVHRSDDEHTSDEHTSDELSISLSVASLLLAPHPQTSQRTQRYGFMITNCLIRLRLRHSPGPSCANHLSSPTPLRPRDRRAPPVPLAVPPPR